MSNILWAQRIVVIGWNIQKVFARPDFDYSRRRFLDLDVINILRGTCDINNGVYATKVFHGQYE